MGVRKEAAGVGGFVHFAIQPFSHYLEPLEAQSLARISLCWAGGHQLHCESRPFAHTGRPARLGTEVSSSDTTLGPRCEVIDTTWSSLVRISRSGSRTTFTEGVKVAVVERQQALHPRPRVVVFCHGSNRIVSSLFLRKQLDAVLEHAVDEGGRDGRNFVWRDKDLSVSCSHEASILCRLT